MSFDSNYEQRQLALEVINTLKKAIEQLSENLTKKLAENNTPTDTRLSIEKIAVCQKALAVLNHPVEKLHTALSGEVNVTKAFEQKSNQLAPGQQLKKAPAKLRLG